MAGSIDLHGIVLLATKAETRRTTRITHVLTRERMARTIAIPRLIRIISLLGTMLQAIALAIHRLIVQMTMAIEDEIGVRIGLTPRLGGIVQIPMRTEENLLIRVLDLILETKIAIPKIDLPATILAKIGPITMTVEGRTPDVPVMILAMTIVLKTIGLPVIVLATIHPVTPIVDGIITGVLEAIRVMTITAEIAADRRLGAAIVTAITGAETNIKMIIGIAATAT